MADAADSKSAGGNIVWVQLPPSALPFNKHKTAGKRMDTAFEGCFFTEFSRNEDISKSFSDKGNIR